MEPLVFGLDIGTRNVVGTVGYKEGTEFIVVAQYIKEHETRAMLDGQIHDIGRVAKTIEAVKQQLEEQIGAPLTEVCIAAAGRVLKTVTTTVEYEYDEETVVTREDIHTLDLLGIEKASGILKEENDTKFKFYCVGYSVVKYYLNEDIFSNLEGHKAERISEDIIVTFLPEDVVDGLYSACNLAGLEVANMTLEPPSYRIQEGDRIELRNYYTIGQLVEFMDVELDLDQEILVNNRDADMATLVYENFSVEWTVVETRTHIEDLAQDEAAPEEPAVSESGKEIEAASEGTQTESEPAATPEEPVKEEKEEPAGIQVIVNKEPIFMSGKAEYIYVDVFDYIEFNLNDSRGRNIVTHLNGQNTEYTAPLKDGDVVDIYWEENN